MISLQEMSDDKKRLLLICIIMMPMLVSWTGILDKLSYNYLDGSLTSATISYVSARAINATISIFQTVEVGIGVASLQVGQVLDPINDMIERFSDLIVIAIGSIITQKIFLTIVSSSFFKILLTISTLLLLVSVYIKENPFIKVLSQLFIFLVFIRFVLSFMVLLNFAVDEAFLADKIKYDQAQIQVLSDELDDIQNDKTNSESNNAILESSIRNLLVQKEGLNNELEMQSSELQKLQEIVNKTKSSIEQADSNLDLVDRYNPIHKDDAIDAMGNRLSEEEALVTEKVTYIEKLNIKIEDIDDNITYNRNVITGESNGVIDSISNGFSDMTESFKGIDVSEIKEKLDKKIGSLLNIINIICYENINLADIIHVFIVKSVQINMGNRLSGLYKA